MKFGVLVFPGSNCDHDTYNVIAEIARQPVTFLWHDSEDLQNVDAVLVPGGFAYGDYLRTGAIARFSPVCSRSGVRRRWRTRPWHLQRISDPYRSRTPARRTDAQCRPQVHLQTGPPPRRNYDSPFTNQLTTGEVLRSPSGTWKATTSARPTTYAACNRKTASHFVIHPEGRHNRRGQSKWFAQ